MAKVILVITLFFLAGITFWYLFPQNQNSVLKNPSSVISNLKSEEIEPLTLEKIFSDKTNTQNLDSGKLITLIVTGDVIPARSVNFQTTQRKDFTWPFQKTADVLKSGDLTFIDLETPLMKNCNLTQEGMKFCGSDKHIEGLKLAGVDVANLANNHSANYGQPEINETVEILKTNEILPTGLNAAVYKEIKGIRFAFLGYNDIEKNSIVTSAEDEVMKKEIGEARKNADVVIVQFHWGTEYLTPPEERQKYLGRLAIDSGADLVIGNHPHWIKPIEFYRGKLITYAHGNFVFDQEWSQKTKEGVVGEYTFYGNKLVDVKYLPVEIVNYGQPYFLEGDKKQKILDEMYQESLKISR